MSETTRIVVVGASAAGLAAAETLRRESFGGSLTIIGDEVHAPYDRPPLSKQVLKGLWEPAKTQLRPQKNLDALNANWLLGSAAASLDADGRQVVLGTGQRVPYDKLVIATGVRARNIPHTDHLESVHVLRSLDDAQRLAPKMRKGASIAVIGSGFLGAEAAAVAVELGLSVTMIDVLEGPMVRQLGSDLAARVAHLHSAHRVTMMFGTGVDEIVEHDQHTRLTLSNGTHLDVDVVLVAIGSVPNTEWLEGSGLEIQDGIVCDEFNLAREDVAAAGDVARWLHRGLDRHLRVEHRMNATEQGSAAAKALLGRREPFTPVPYFWTDQFDVKIQAYGTLTADAEVEVVEGSIDSDNFACAYRQNNRVVGVLTWNMPREARRLRQLVLDNMIVPSIATTGQ